MWPMLTYGLHYYHSWVHQYFGANEFSFIRPIIKMREYLYIQRVLYEKRKEQDRSYAKKYRDNNKEKINYRLREKRCGK